MFFLLDKDGWTKGAVEVTDGTNIPGRHPDPKVHVGQVPHDGEQVLWSDVMFFYFQNLHICINSILYSDYD